MFKTSYTVEWFRRAAGMVKNVMPIGKITGFPVEISWIRLQQLFRSVTSDVPYLGGDGHVGLLVDADGGPLTVGQSHAHEMRNDAILATTIPEEGLLAAIKAHVLHSANAGEMSANLNRKGIDSFGLSAGNAKQRAQIIERLLRVRDQWKMLRIALGGRAGSLSPVRAGTKLATANPNISESLARSIPIGKYYGRYITPQLFAEPASKKQKHH